MKIKSVERCGKADVFNLEVEDTHDFVIQGGAVAHNCADAARYMCMARPIKPRMKAERDPYYDSPLAQVFDIKKEDLTAIKPQARMEIIS